MNVELLRQVMEQVTRHPETHDQGYWARRDSTCGTTYCVAGWAVTLRDYDLNWIADGDDEGGRWDEAELVADGDSIELVAEDELDLTDEQVDDLLYDATTLDELWDAVERHTGGALRRADVEAVRTGRESRDVTDDR